MLQYVLEKGCDDTQLSNLCDSLDDQIPLQGLQRSPCKGHYKFNQLYNNNITFILFWSHNTRLQFGRTVCHGIILELQEV